MDKEIRCRGCGDVIRPYDIEHTGELGICVWCWSLGTPNEFLYSLISPEEYSNLMEGGE
jgi:hypothetical protein